MCEANAYLLKEGNEGDHIRIENIFGEQKLVFGRIRSMSLVNHRIVLEE
jgi:predicted RNA-binding protein